MHIIIKEITVEDKKNIKKSRYVGRILMISLHGYVSAQPELGKPDTGGQVTFVIELAKRFSRFGFKVDIVTRRFEKQPEFDVINSACRIWRIPFGGKKFIRKEDMHDHVRNFITNFLAEIRGRGTKYDVVNSHYWDAGWAGQRIAEELNISHIHTPHSLGWWKRRDMKNNGEHDPEEQEKIYRFKERIDKEFRIYRNCDHIIPTTQQQASVIEKNYDILPTHMTVIPAGMDEERFRPVRGAHRQELREKHGIKEKDVLTLGRMALNKGFDLLIKAMKTVIDSVPDARLVLGAGAESKRDNLKREELYKLMRDLNLEDKVLMLDYIQEEELPEFYLSAGVFALPSRYEPFGMTAIEAMACGTPTVITIHGGLHNLVDFGSHALYANPENPNEFGTILTLPLRYQNLSEELSLQGSRFARRNFSWTGIAKRTLDLFARFKDRYSKDNDDYMFTNSWR